MRFLRYENKWKRCLSWLLCGTTLPSGYGSSLRVDLTSRGHLQETIRARRLHGLSDSVAAGDHVNQRMQRLGKSCHRLIYLAGGFAAHSPLGKS